MFLTDRSIARVLFPLKFDMTGMKTRTFEVNTQVF